MSADELVGLIGGAPAERSAALSALEATADAQLAAKCVPPLLGLLARPAAELAVAEFERVCLLLSRLGSLDPVAVGAEMFGDLRLLALFTEGNALDVCLAKPLEEMTKEDVLLAAAARSCSTAAISKGWDPALAAAGLTFMEFYGPATAASPHGPVKSPDDARNLRLCSLTLDLLKTDRAQLTDAHVAGAWYLLANLIQTRSGVALQFGRAGGLAAAVAELRAAAPADWVSLRRDPSNKFGIIFMAMFNGILPLNMRNAEHSQLVAGTDGLLEAMLGGLKAFEEAGCTEDTSVIAVWAAVSVLMVGGFAKSEASREALVAAAGTLRFVLDHPVAATTDLQLTSNSSAVRFPCSPSPGCFCLTVLARCRQCSRPTCSGARRRIRGCSFGSRTSMSSWPCSACSSTPRS